MRRVMLGEKRAMVDAQSEWTMLSTVGCSEVAVGSVEHVVLFVMA